MNEHTHIYAFRHAKAQAHARELLDVFAYVYIKNLEGMLFAYNIHSRTVRLTHA